MSDFLCCKMLIKFYLYIYVCDGITYDLTMVYTLATQGKIKDVVYIEHFLYCEIVQSAELRHHHRHRSHHHHQHYHSHHNLYHQSTSHVQGLDRLVYYVRLVCM